MVSSHVYVLFDFPIIISIVISVRNILPISTLGSNKYIPGYEDQMIGLFAGEEKKINVTFPEDYR